MEDEERTAPRNQDEAAEGTPMARSSSSTTSGPGCSKPTPRSPSALSSSDKNSVLLSDWWLVKVEGGAEGKRLAVSGFTTGQQAMRIFSSAPILKRYDAYNLETADGITVIILGLINKARTHDNGFPPEVCNRFLVGFPYNWDYYADKYFRRSSISASNSSNSAGFGGLSKDSADGAGHTSAVCVNVFPFGRLCDILITSGGTLTRNLIESLKKLFGYPSLNPTAQKPSLLPVETHSECDTDKSDSKHENSKGFATVINHDAEGHATSHGEKGYYAKELHAGDVPIENSNLNHDISHYSLMHENRETATQPVAETTSETETGTDMQMETLLANIKEVEKDNNMMSSVPVDCDDVDHVPACIEGKVNAESRIDSSCVRMKCLLEDSLLKESNLSDLRHDEELGDDAVRRQHCVENLRMPNVGFSDDLLVEKDCDPKTANSLKVTMNAGSQNSLDSDVTEPLKVSLREEGVGTRSKISSQNEEMVPSILSASQGDADSHHVEGRPWDLKNSKAPNFDFTGISKDSSSNEIEDMCYSILEKIECCKLPAVKDPTSQIGTAFDMTITKTSKVKESPTKEHLTKVVKGGGQKKKNFQKGDWKYAECINSEVCLHFSIPETRRSIDEEKLTGRFPFCATKELSTTENVHGDVSLLALHTRNRCRNSSASSEGRLLESSITVKAETLNTRMKPSKKKGNDNLIAGHSLEVEKNGVRSVPRDHDIVNAPNDTMRTSTCKHALDLATVEVGKGSLESSPMKLDTEDREHGLQPCIVSTPAATGVMHRLDGGHAHDCIGMNGDNQSESLKCAVKTPNHLDYSVKKQSSNNTKLAMTGENIVSIPNDQDKLVIKMELLDLLLDVDGIQAKEFVVMEQPSREKKLHTTRKGTAWRPISSVYQSPNTRGKAHKLSMASPEYLNLKRSRSGRLIVPPLANWCQQIVYDVDGSITGIRGVDVLNSPGIGSKSETVKKRKMFT